MVSVLLPVYNCQKYIYSAIKSILDQTYKNFELLILDDCSTDDTLRIVNLFNDSRIQIFKEEKNYGLVYQLNKGLKFAKGEFIARMDADDISFPKRFEIQVHFLNKHKNIDIVGSNALRFGFKFNSIKNPTCPKSIHFHLNFYCPIIHPTVMMRSKLFIWDKHEYKNILHAEDYQLWIDISNGKNIANIKEPLLYYRVHNNQVGSKFKDQQYNSAFQLRCYKLRNLLPFASKRYIEQLSKMAGDYIFYGQEYTNMNSFWDVNLLSRIYLRLLRIVFYKERKNIIEYVILNS